MKETFANTQKNYPLSSGILQQGAAVAPAKENVKQENISEVLRCAFFFEPEQFAVQFYRLPLDKRLANKYEFKKQIFIGYNLKAKAINKDPSALNQVSLTLMSFLAMIGEQVL